MSQREASGLVLGAMIWLFAIIMLSRGWAVSFFHYINRKIGNE